MSGRVPGVATSLNPLEVDDGSKATSSATFLKYSELEEGTIRIFELFAARDNEPIIGSLRKVRLDDKCEPFQALSYAWGDDTLRTAITCDGSTLLVTENLHSILRRLRQQDSSLVLWVDAICINQGKDATALREKAKQIAMMKDIFSSAFQVIIDLGQTDYNFDYVLHILEQYVLIEPGKDSHTISGDFVLPGSQVSDYEDFEFWRGLLTLTRLPWFNRLWCFQEFILARHIVTLVGSRLVTRFDLHLGVARAYTRLSEAADKIDMSPLNADMSIDTDVTKSQRAHRLLLGKHMLRSRQQTIRRTTLDPVIAASRTLEVSDMRDRIYAVFALLPAEITSGFDVDYNEDVGVLQRRISRQFIQKHHVCWVLFYAIGPNLDNIPSWTMSLSPGEKLDWNQYKLAECAGCLADFHPSFDRKEFFLAGGDGLCTHHLDSSLERVMFEGCRFDHIVSMSKRFSAFQQSDPDMIASNLCNGFIDILTWAKQNRLPDKDVRRLLMFDGYGEIRCDSQYRDAAARDSAFTKSYESLVQFLFSDNDVEQAQELLLAGLTFIHTVAVCMPNMVIAITAKGYLAAVPYTAAIGDSITIIGGIPAPFVLRENNSEYQLVGSCYLHGFMDGEALEHADWKPELLTII